MKITAIETSRHRVGVDPPFPPTWDSRPRESFEATIVRVRTDEGLVGICSGDDMFGLDSLHHLFVGHDPLDLERHRRIIDNLTFHYARYWPLEVALWDLAGKAAGKPCWQMLGGRSGRVRCYASSGVARDGAGWVRQARRVIEAGFPAMKLRFRAASWREDVEKLRHVRTELGSALDLMVDCNQAWRMPWDTAEAWPWETALEVARHLAELGVRWMEEPLHRADYDGMRRLREESGVPIAGGEMTREMYELRELVMRRSVDVLQPDVVLTGGLKGLVELARDAAEVGVALTPHTWGNGIGLVANAHLVAAVGRDVLLEYPWDPPEWSLETRDFMLGSPVGVDSAGWLELGDEPGLGLQIDEDVLARTRVG